MKKLIIALAVLALFAGMAYARQAEERVPATPYEGTTGRAVTVWYDDNETGAPGWTHGDFTAVATPKFHVDTYLAYDVHSWWCGTFDYDADGGYGNSWDQRLDVPPTDWTGYTYPIIMYYFRNDSEVGYDFSYVEAESNGVYVALNRGYDGKIPWGQAGFYLGNKDNPAVCRFRFVSDGAWSDEDGLYTSLGGAFHCDEIQILDYITGDVLFYDDVESGGLCTPSVPAAAGDYWHLDNWLCRAYSGDHYWEVCWPGTSYVQPNLQNWLQTPVVDISAYEPVQGCTLYTVFQLFMPGTSGGYWTEEATTDGGATWTQTGAWYGDQCGYGYGPCDHFLFSIPVRPIAGTGNQVAVRWTMYTDALGNSADPACSYISAGITIDDTWFDVTEEPSAVEDKSWGRIKSMYR